MDFLGQFPNDHMQKFLNELLAKKIFGGISRGIAGAILTETPRPIPESSPRGISKGTFGGIPEEFSG